MPHEADIPEIRQIFLSATAQDCRTYREAVRDFIHDNIEHEHLHEARTSVSVHHVHHHEVREARDVKRGA